MEAPTIIGRSVEVRGRLHRYAVYVPPAELAPRPLPVLVFLHGEGEAGVDGWRPTRVGLGPCLHRAPERWPFLVVFPQKPPEGGASWLPHEGLLHAVLAEATSGFPADDARIYGTGIATGAVGLWALAARDPGFFAAVAPVGGGGDLRWARRLAHVPAWVFHGERDEAIPPSRARDMAEALRRAGGSPRLTVFPEAGHNAWDLAYRSPDLPAWFLRFRRRALTAERRVGAMRG
jgi:predicted peptidase